MSTQSSIIVQRIWIFDCNILRDDDIAYCDYVERRLSEAQEVESVVAASVARASRLRQSVLKSAFEGKL